ncbi:MAG TPA: hypothetical protein VFF69_09010 [Phycisphaerales bacterium]|nr:hypothetical protein [Phycisphaerales bacterium]
MSDPSPRRPPRDLDAHADRLRRDHLHDLGVDHPIGWDKLQPSERSAWRNRARATAAAADTSHTPPRSAEQFGLSSCDPPKTPADLDAKPPASAENGASRDRTGDLLLAKEPSSSPGNAKAAQEQGERSAADTLDQPDTTWDVRFSFGSGEHIEVRGLTTGDALAELELLADHALAARDALPRWRALRRRRLEHNHDVLMRAIAQLTRDQLLQAARRARARNGGAS